jgi:hypothetical protein
MTKLYLQTAGIVVPTGIDELLGDVPSYQPRKVG